MSNGKKLVDELRRCPGKTVMLGVRSSFFFIGPSEEALADLPLLGMMSRHCVSLASNRIPSYKALSRVSEDIGLRNVVKTYVRNPEGLGDEIVILLEGKEFGAFWTRTEYLAGKCLLLQALEHAQ